MRAKFRCSRVQELKGTPWRATAVQVPAEEKLREEVEFYAVTGSGVNAEWSKATPGGYLRMTIDNPAAWGHFVDGAEYFLDFAAAVPPAS